MSKTMQDSVAELKETVEEIRESVKDLQRTMYKGGWVKWTRPTVEQLLKEGHQWEVWYAWRPVQDIHGCWHWRKNIYRILGNTYMDHDSARWYHYGTDFDVLKHD